MAWNGAGLVSDFSAELGDTSDTFKARVLGWINDGFIDIGTSHNWPFMRERGQSVLAANQDTHNIVPSAPSAPSVAISTGGSLTDTSVYKVLVTFYESVSGVESIRGTESASVTASVSDLAISLTSIPVSSFPLVTSRKIYLSKDGGSFFYHSEVADNTTTTASISTDTTSTQLPPDDSYIYVIDGDLYLENNRVLKNMSLQGLRFETNAQLNSTGTPSVWASVNQEQIITYPKPMSATTVTFYYFKMPGYVFDSSNSKLPMPQFMYECIHDYVIWRGFQYRDRNGQESKRANYDNNLRTQISRKGSDKKGSGRVRSVTADSDGYQV